MAMSDCNSLVVMAVEEAVEEVVEEVAAEDRDRHKGMTRTLFPYHIHPLPLMFSLPYYFHDQK